MNSHSTIGLVPCPKRLNFLVWNLPDAAFKKNFNVDK